MKNNLESSMSCSFTSVNEYENNEPINNILNDILKDNISSKDKEDHFFDEDYSGRKTISFDNKFDKRKFNKNSLEDNFPQINEEGISSEKSCFGRNTISFDNQFKKNNKSKKKEENIFPIHEDDNSLDLEYNNIFKKLDINDICEEDVEDNNDSGYFKSVLKEIQQEEIKRHICETEEMSQIQINNNLNNNYGCFSDNFVKKEKKNQIMVLASELKDEDLKISKSNSNSKSIPLQDNVNKNNNNNTINSTTNTIQNLFEHHHETHFKEENDMKTSNDVSISKRTTTNSLNNNANNNVLIQSFSYCNNNNIRHTYDYGINHQKENLLSNNFTGFQDYSSENRSFNPYGSLQMFNHTSMLNNQNDQNLNSKSLPFNFTDTNYSQFNQNLSIPIPNNGNNDNKINNISNVNMFHYYNNNHQYYSPQMFMNNMVGPMMNLNNLPFIYPTNMYSNYMNNNESVIDNKSKKKVKKSKNIKNKKEKKKEKDDSSDKNEEMMPNFFFKENQHPLNNKFDLYNQEISNKNSIEESVNFYISMNDEKFIQCVNTKEGSRTIQSILEFYIKNGLHIPLDFFLKFITNNIYVFMNDRYGNYVLDKLIILMEVKHRKILYENDKFKKHFLEICCGIYSNIVLQKLIKTMKSIIYEEEKIIELILENFDNLYTNKMANLCFHTIFDIFTVESSSKIVNVLIKRLVKIANYNKFGHYLAKNFIITFKKKYDLYMKDVRMSYSKKSSKKTDNDGNELTNVKNVVKTISKLRLDFLNSANENLSNLAYDKYGHLVIVDLIENWGREYCNSLINNFISKINSFNKVIYGYAICKKIFLLYYKEKNYIESISSSIINNLDFYSFNEKLGLSSNLLKASIIFLSSSAYEEFYNSFIERKIELIQKLQKKSSENFLLIIEELRYKNYYKDKLEVLKEIFVDDKNIFE